MNENLNLDHQQPPVRFMFYVITTCGWPRSRSLKARFSLGEVGDTGDPGSTYRAVHDWLVTMWFWFHHDPYSKIPYRFFVIFCDMFVAICSLIVQYRYDLHTKKMQNLRTQSPSDTLRADLQSSLQNYKYDRLWWSRIRKIIYKS